MKTEKLIEILEHYHNQNLILSFTFSPTDKRFTIIYELVTGSKYIDIYEFSEKFNNYFYKSTQKISDGNKNG